MSKHNINPEGLPFKKRDFTINEIIRGLESKDRMILSKALTYIESKSQRHLEARNKILEWAYQQKKVAKRIGLTGSPGAGKSTMIEQLGIALTQNGESLAVLSIDPSSAMSGGSILGDKTRMERLSQEKNAFIRPSPAKNVLGGVAGATREAISLCEAVGYDWIIVETVGVGQSELAIYDMTDVFVLLLLPGAGDSLQGIKRGIVEMADIILVNKSDGDRVKLAKRTESAYRNAISLLPPKESQWKPRIQRASALNGDGIGELLENLKAYFEHIHSVNFLETNRKRQALHFFHKAIDEGMRRRLSKDDNYQRILEELKSKVERGEYSAVLAADKFVSSIFSNGSH